MQTQLLLSIYSEDKPGVVEQVAKAISSNNGNWLESRFSQLAGLFAGLVQIHISQENIDALEQSLLSLKPLGINVRTHTPPAEKAIEQSTRARFHALGADKPGIVKELTQAFSQSSINIEEINSKITSMPYSGDPAFEADGVISIPASASFEALEDKLIAIGDQMGVDFSIQSIS